MKLLSPKITAGAGPQVTQIPKVTNAMPTTVGTNTAAIRSASCWIGGFEAWACSTSLMIAAKAVSFPTLVASKTNEPVLFKVAPKTTWPDRFSTGRLSPVSIDSSTAEAPSRTTPSTGIFSPGRTRIRSPTRTSSMGTSVSTTSVVNPVESSPIRDPSRAPIGRSTLAVLGCRPMSFLIASLVRPRALVSSQRPRMIRVWRTATASK